MSGGTIDDMTDVLEREITYHGVPTRITKDVMTGQWHHPKYVKRVVCGLPSSTFGKVFPGSKMPPGASEICLAIAGSGTNHLGYGPCSKHNYNPGRGADQRGVEVLAQMRSRRALMTLGIPITIDPVDALLHLVHEAAGNLAFLGARAADLGLQLVGDVYSLSRDGDPIATSEDARAIVKLYGEWADRLAKYAKIAIDAGIEERRVKVQEDQARAMVTIIRAVVLKLALPADVQRLAMTYLADEMRSLAGGEGGGGGGTTMVQVGPTR